MLIVSHSFCGSGIQERLHWVVVGQDLSELSRSPPQGTGSGGYFSRLTPTAADRAAILYYTVPLHRDAHNMASSKARDSGSGERK